MTRAVVNVLASWGFVERSFALVRRYLSWELVWLFYTMVNTLTIGLIGVGATGAKGQEMVLYLVIGALLWAFLSTLFQAVADSVSWERWEGTVEYSFMAPVSRLVYLGGNSLFGIIYALVRTVIVMTAVVLWFRLDMSSAHYGAALAVLLASSFSFMGLGLLAAVLPLMSPERGAQATHVIQGLLLLISGVYYPVNVLPHWLQPIAALSPGTYTLDGIRAALMHGATLTDVLPIVGKLLLMGVVLIPIGIWIFSLGEQYALRTGKLKRNG